MKPTPIIRLDSNLSLEEAYDDLHTIDAALTTKLRNAGLTQNFDTTLEGPLPVLPIRHVPIRRRKEIRIVQSDNKTLRN